VLIIGIDPGLDGSIATIGEGVLYVFDMPTIKVSRAKGSRREIIATGVVDLITTIIANNHSRPILALVERQQALPKQGSTSGFRTGLGVGLIVGVLAGLRVPFEWVEAQKWKPGIGLPRGSDKGASIELASRLFPTVEIGRRDGRAEALLIAEYGRRKLGLERAA
jgi:hypothetical protein